MRRQIYSKLVKRFFSLLVLLVFLSILVFGLMVLAPGDPAEKRLISQGVAVTREVLEAERARLGFFRPFVVRYADWLTSILHGDWGLSLKDDLPVAPKLIAGLKKTVRLATASLLLSLLVSFPLGILSAIRKNKPVDHVIRLISFLGNSIPSFLLAVLLMYFFCIRSNLFPVIAKDSIAGLFLPALCLGIPMTARFTRQIRSELISEYQEPYIPYMRVRGVRERTILIWHVLRNSMGHILTIIGLQIGTLMGGSVVIENIFRYPGIGKLVMDAINARDYPVIMGFTLIMGTIYVTISFLADLSYELLDPRVKGA